MKIQVGGVTDVGLHRNHNEDDFALFRVSDSRQQGVESDQEVDEKGFILFVADGMGGANAGEVASLIAKETVINHFEKLELSKIKSEQTFLGEVLIHAHKAIVREQKRNKSTLGMGTTAMIAWIIEEKVIMAWSGDSRAYLIREDYPTKPLTDDHSLVWEMVLSGKISAEEARMLPESNIILQCLGDKNNPPKPDFKTIILSKGDVLLLCSDGLNGMISDEAIFQICRQEKPIPELMQELISAANLAGGHDNITALMAKVIEVPDREEGQQTVELIGHSQEDIAKKGMLKFSKTAKFVVVLIGFSIALIWYASTQSRLGERGVIDPAQVEEVNEPSSESVLQDSTSSRHKGNPTDPKDSIKLDQESNSSTFNSSEESSEKQNVALDTVTNDKIIF